MAESGGGGSARGKEETQGLNVSPLGNLMVTYFERRVSSLIESRVLFGLVICEVSVRHLSGKCEAGS